MKESKVLAIISIVFGVSQVIKFLPFPDLMLVLVILAEPMPTLAFFSSFFLPLMAIIMGATGLFKENIGLLSLLLIYSICFIICIWSLITLPFFGINHTTIIIVFNCLFFMGLIVWIYSVFMSLNLTSQNV